MVKRRNLAVRNLANSKPAASARPAERPPAPPAPPGRPPETNVRQMLLYTDVFGRFRDLLFTGPVRQQMRRSQRRVPSLNLSTRPRNLQNASKIQQIWEFKFRHIPLDGTVERAQGGVHGPPAVGLLPPKVPGDMDLL